MMKKMLMLSFLFIFAWIGSYFLVFECTREMGAPKVYGLISSWWFAAYISCRFKFPLIVALPAGVIYYFSFLVVSMSGIDWFYHDVDGLGFFHAMIIGATQTLIFTSPIFFDRFVDLLLKIPVKEKKNWE